jgi:hypothetical protein
MKNPNTAKFRNTRWAPLNQDVEVLVTDGVEEYLIHFPCRRTENGWIDSKFKAPLSETLKVVAWRKWG